MSAPIRRVAMLIVIGMVAIVANLHWVQLVRAAELSDHPRNRRLLFAEYEIDRGAITAGDTLLATSAPSAGEFRFTREYPEATRFAHVVGWHSFHLQKSGLEAALNTDLNGAPLSSIAQNLVSLLDNRARVGNTVETTINPAVQTEAQRALGSRRGAVVVVESATGRVVSAWSAPSFDPNRLAAPDFTTARDAFDELTDDESRPLLDRTRLQTYPPGSTFKLIVAAAALEGGLAPETAFENLAEYVAPQTSRPITNFSPGRCGSGETITLQQALVTSCNTVFAALGVQLGVDELTEQARAFGFDRRPPYTLPVATSVFPQPQDPPALAQAAIGQRDVRVSPLHMATIVGAIATNGELKRPHLISRIVDESGRGVRGPDSGPWTEAGFSPRAISSRTAAQLKQMMIDAVETGTGRRAQISGVTVGGKTGTAQVPDQTPTVWFVGFAERGNESYSVAVVVENAGETATGGGVAAPIARAVLEQAFGIR